MGTYWKSFGDDFTIANHSSIHEDGGRDEISVDGLEGYLAWPQSGGTPGSHAATHENGGADEIGVDGLSGSLADPQTPVAHALTGDKHTGLDILDGYLTDDDVTHLLTYGDIDGYAKKALLDSYATLDHSARHEVGGADEIGVDGLSGSLADPQMPIAHALTGPYHTGYNVLDGYLTDDNVSHFLVYSDIDGYAKKALLDSYAVASDFESHSARHEVGGADEIGVDGLSGSLADPQTPAAHALTGDKHTGLDVLDGYLTEVTPHALTGDRHTGLDVLDGYATVSEFSNHSARHENGGADEISVAGLDGYTAYAQDAYALQGRYISEAAPEDSYVLVWKATTQRWEPDLPGGVLLQRILAASSLRI